MWTRGVLERYADQVPEPEKKERLAEAITTIRFESAGAIQMVAGQEAEQAFERAGLGDLYDDLSSRTLEFVTEDDLRALQL